MRGKRGARGREGEVLSKWPCGGDNRVVSQVKSFELKWDA